MTALLIVVLAAVFIVADLVVRSLSQKLAARRERAERESVLKTALTLSTTEARTLRRAEVPHARARILAVDDEPVILDSFRKILVLAGFSVDTVESGPEALGLLGSRAYDFLFTDLKMPAMNGIEVVKAAKHLRPDIDVAVITGYGTIESAVETMQFGAVDYVQKPFTEEELVAIANRLLIKREARLASQQRPTVRVVAPAVAETVAAQEYCVPGGAFVSAGHAWARIDPAGQVWVGMDDFARKAVRRIDRLETPAVGTRVTRGQALFTLRRGGEALVVYAPVAGEVTQVNAALAHEPQLAMQSPYDRGWVCLVRPSALAGDLAAMRIGRPVVEWYQNEVERLREVGSDASLPELQAAFFAAGVVENVAVGETVALG
jgi:CheY-like chemotaxis protein